MKKRCDNCQCWERDGVDGICRAKCPKSAVIDCKRNPNLQLVWPRTKPSDWCFEGFLPVEKQDNLIAPFKSKDTE